MTLSTFKLLASAVVLSRVDAGSESLQRRITYRKKDLVNHSPVTNRYVDGQNMTLAQLCEATLTTSYNTAANLIFASFGGPSRVTAIARKIGDRVTRLDRIETELNVKQADGMLDTTSTRAMAMSMRKLVLGDALSAPSQELLQQLLAASMLQGRPVSLDNGQHILIGAYSETLRLMAALGIDEQTALLRLPLTLQFPDGNGLKLPASRWWPAPLDAFAGILNARGWSWADRLSLLKVALGWQFRGFRCASNQSVADLCRGLTAATMAQLIEPLCVSALNTPADRASGEVFLRVMHDSLFAENGGSNLLLPKVDLSALLPDAALVWLRARGGAVQLGVRVPGIICVDQRWKVTTQFPSPSDDDFDSIVLACPPLEAARLVEGCGMAADVWLSQTRGLQYEALTTVYAHAPGARLSQPMLALPATGEAPAQFVFDRGQLGGPAGLLAFVISASQGEGAVLTARVLAQAAAQLGLQLEAVQTIVEKRATFACTPGLQRPGAVVASGLLACGDYVDGPYPATLEGAVRSGLAAARSTSTAGARWAP